MVKKCDEVMNSFYMDPEKNTLCIEHNYSENSNESCESGSTSSISVQSENATSTKNDTLRNVNPYSFEEITCICRCSEEFDDRNNYLRGCKWSPDHVFLAANSNDNVLRFFVLPDVMRYSYKTYGCISPAVYIKPGGIIYDFEWLPSHEDVSLSSLLCASSLGPVHLWDVCSREIIASYHMYDDKDEVAHAISVACSPNGDKIYSGMLRSVYIFDTERPGRDSYIIKDKNFGRGIVSSIAVNSVRHSLFAVGTYNKRIALCDERSLLCVFFGHRKGITHMKFSPDGTFLYSGTRGNGDIVCWDLRKPGVALFKAIREVNTQQRIYFDLTSDGDYLISGSTNGKMYIWNLRVTPETEVLPPSKIFEDSTNSTNGISIHGRFPIVATTSGQYHPEDPSVMLDTDEDTDIRKDHSVKFYRIGSSDSFRRL